MAADHCSYACRYSQDDLLMFKLSIRMRTKGNLRAYEHEIVVVVAGFSESSTQYHSKACNRPAGPSCGCHALPLLGVKWN